MSQTYYFKLLPGHFTDFHETLYTASVDSPDKKLLKEFWYSKQYNKLLNNNSLYILLETQSVVSPHWSVQMKWNSSDYFPVSH